MPTKRAQKHQAAEALISKHGGFYKLEEKLHSLAELETVGRLVKEEGPQLCRRAIELAEAFASGGPHVKRGPRRGKVVCAAWRKRLAHELADLGARQTLLFDCARRSYDKARELRGVEWVKRMEELERKAVA